MFWGLIMEPQKRYSQVIKKAFHISMASLDLSNSDDQPAQILCGYEGKNYLLCTLQNPDQLQCSLDLYFEEGRTVSFASNGRSHIHLTGYLTKEVEQFGDVSDEEDAQEFEVQAKKHLRSKDNSIKEPVKKRLKLESIDEEEDSDDSDFNIEKYFEEASGEESEEEDAEDMLSDEEGDLEDESMGEEEDEDEEDPDQEETEVEDDDDGKVEEKKEKVENGLSKKSKKNKKEEQQTTPTKKNKPNKEKQHELTPGPKKQDKSNSVDQKSKEKSKGKEEKKNKESSPSVPKKRTLSNGVIVEEIRVGQGDSVATNGKFIHVYYEGRLKSNNKLFDKTMSGPGFGFRLGKGEVIKGWDIGVSGMRVGGKRRIICPPQAGYGAKGSPPVIPPNSTLVFDVELRKIK